MTKEKRNTLLGGLIIGLIAAFLMHKGNPGNMGLCIACFLRDISGALQLHTAPVVQYIRPEIIGIILGAFATSIISKDFKSRGGSDAILRFIFGIFMMIGALAFLGCPLRLILRLAGGDLNAITGFVGFFAGIATGSFFLKKGAHFTTEQEQDSVTGFIMPILAVVFLVFLLVQPAFIAFSTEGPGSMHAPIIIALIAGLITGVILQRTRICSTGAFRNILLAKDYTLSLGILGIFLGALALNLVYGKVNWSFTDQPIAHTMHLWNFLGLYLVGFIGVLLGGCPIRQLVLSADGDGDAAITVLGLMVGAAICHNFGLAASGEGLPINGQIAVVIGIVFTFIIAIYQSKKD